VLAVPETLFQHVPGLEFPPDLKDEQEPNPLDLPQPRIFLFDLANSANPEVLIAPHGYIGDLAFSPDSKTIALGGLGCVWLFNCTSAN
jgi:hypothetical protein